MVAGTWLDHKNLMIIKGIGKTPGDIYSAESDPVIVNLMSGIISLVDWIPEIAQVKAGGIWADSPLSDGRELLVAAAGNVIEKMSVIITDNSYLGAMKALNGLNQMANDCRDYWQTEYQINPVYLAWWAGCGVGLQYALLSNIEVSPDYLDSPKPTIRASITLEREPYWRGIPPGANPKIWTYYVNASHPQYNVNVSSLITGSDHLITATIQNKHEWSPTAYGLQITPLTKNYIDISADLVPGDAPALVQLEIEAPTNPKQATFAYVAHTTKPFSARGRDGITRGQALNLNAGDAVSGVGSMTKTITTNDFGVLSNNSSTVYYNGVRTVTGIDVSYSPFAYWGDGSAFTPILSLDREIYRGTFAVFVRAFNTSAAAPAIGDMVMRVSVSEADENNILSTVVLNEVAVPLLSTIIDDLTLTYMGTVSIPFTGKSVTSAFGYGRQTQSGRSNIRVLLEQKVLVATANRSFTLIDVVFVPIDEGMTLMTNPIQLGGSPYEQSLILDNTGYMMRGNPKQIGFSVSRTFADVNAVAGGSAVETRGQDIMLSPKVNQRLYFVNSYFYSGTRYGLQSNYSVRMNIVPRWSGIRDS